MQTLSFQNTLARLWNGEGPNTECRRIEDVTINADCSCATRISFTTPLQTSITEFSFVLGNRVTDCLGRAMQDAAFACMINQKIPTTVICDEGLTVLECNNASVRNEDISRIFVTNSGHVVRLNVIFDNRTKLTVSLQDTAAHRLGELLRNYALRAAAKYQQGASE